MEDSRMEVAIKYRRIALRIVKDGLNWARYAIREQITAGRVNLTAIQAVAEQGGYRPTEIDAAMDAYMSRRVAEEVPRATYYSEENKRNVYPKNGDIYAWCDPLDGTTNAFTVSGGYAIVLFFDQFVGDGFDHLGGAIASFDGTVVSWQHIPTGEGEVFIDWPADFLWPGSERARPTGDFAFTGFEVGAPPFSVRLASGSASNGQPGTVTLHEGHPKRFASVAYTCSRRRDLHQLFDFDEERAGTTKEDRLYLSTLAGNPFVTPLLVGQLGAIVEPHSIKLHDAAYLFPLVISRGVAVDLNDQKEAPIWEVCKRKSFDDRVIGPFIASVGDAPIKELMKRRRE